MERTVSIKDFIELIPIGNENAISREALTKVCDDLGLIEPDAVDKDRAMRQLVEKAKQETVIISKYSGGYFRPDPTNDDDVRALREYVHREEKRARAIFFGMRKMTDLLADIDKGRFKELGYNPYQE